MFCKNCGVKLEDGTKFCPECGTSVEGSILLPSTDVNIRSMSKGIKNAVNIGIGKLVSLLNRLHQMMPANLRQKVSSRALGLCCIPLVAVLTVFVISNTTGGYKGVVDKVYKSLKNADGELYYSIMADDYIQERMEWHNTKEEMIEDYQASMEKQLNNIKSDCGDDVKITYKITDTYQPTKEQVQSLNRYIEDYGFEENSVQDAIVAYTTMYAEGSLGAYEYTRDILVLKVRGKWCITGGMIDLSWYSN